MIRNFHAGTALVGLLVTLSACSALDTPGTDPRLSATGSQLSPIPGTENRGSPPYSVIAELPPDPGTETLQILGTRPGVTQRFLLAVPKNASATVVLLAGGSGNLGIDISGRLHSGHTDFLTRSRRLFLRQGIAVATLDVPSDRKDRHGLNGGFRTSPEHAADIDAVVAFLSDRLRLPVWLIGTDRGSASVANAGIRLNHTRPGSPDGLVMSGTITSGDERGTNVLSQSLGSIRQPVLIVHHRQDRCRLAPYENVMHLKRAMVRAHSVEVLAYDGGDRRSRPCGALSHHGFLGISRQVVMDVGQRIRTLTPKMAVVPSQ